MVESTYNWYWLVDGLIGAGYRVHLANPAAIKQDEGLKFSNDHIDARFLAPLLRLGILPEGGFCLCYPTHLEHSRGQSDQRQGHRIREVSAAVRFHRHIIGAV